MNIHFKKGMTLTELIIATVLVGIVTLGLVAAEQAVRMSRQSSMRDSQISGQMQATMLVLNRSASLTVGDSANTGIYQYLSSNDMTTCFRQGAGDVNVYTDDVWTCWWVDISSGGNPVLTSCENLNSPVTTCNGQASLREWVTLVFEGSYTQFCSVVDTGGFTITPPNAIITGTKVAYIQLTLQSRHNKDKAAHPIENPDYTLTANISPSGLSR
ncbi:MAG: type II secretion system protein [Candidatus Omnitrophica bacterium]|nr:type II secretion system protein [Candidatus Omnitrophota bacterium]